MNFRLLPTLGGTALFLLALLAGFGARQEMPRASAASVPPSLEEERRLEELGARVALLERALGLSHGLAPHTLASREQEWEQLRLRLARLEGQQASIWQAIPSITPVEGARVSSPYSSRRYHPIRQRYQEHAGTDLAVPSGTPIRSPADGRVADLGYNASYGYFVDIEHGFGFMTRYGHASRILVQLGQTVRRGEKIALVGSTGLSTGPHLHYEVYHQGVTVNPQDYLLDAGAATSLSPRAGWSP